MNRFKCPKCGSENIQSYEVIYTGGQSNHFEKTESASVGSDWSVGHATTEGNSISKLAQTCVPPKPKEKAGCFVYIFVLIIGGVVSLLFPFVGIPLLIFLIWAIRSGNKDDEKFNAEEFPKIYQDWKHSYYCHRCGNRFIIK